MKIVAFLQNQWFKNPDRVRKMIAQDGEELRRRLLVYALFAGCLTGRRLKAAFGEELCEEIHWEEISREIGGHASSVFPPDFAHIKAVLQAEQPDIVLAFGKLAGDAVFKCRAEIPFVYFLTAPHPAARHTNVIDDLNRMRDEVVRILNLQKQKI